MSQIDEILAQLSLVRPVFHSEADFQHALAWQLHQQYPNARVRLEYRPLPTQPLYLDLWVEHNEQVLAIELKYPTREVEVEHDGEAFSLKNQAAQDLTRYDFVKDVVRLERIVDALPNVTGYAVMLTNDSTYWSLTRRPTTVDAAFRLHEGTILTGSLAWASHASSGTTKGRTAAHQVNGTYPLAWRDYATIAGSSQPGLLRYLALPIERIPARAVEA